MLPVHHTQPPAGSDTSDDGSTGSSDESSIDEGVELVFLAEEERELFAARVELDRLKTTFAKRSASQADGCAMTCSPACMTSGCMPRAIQLSVSKASLPAALLPLLLQH